METIGWVTVAEANTYMSTRLGASEWWDTNTLKEAALKTAYNRLLTGKWSFPEEATQAMKDAQCEMALFLLSSTPDARMNLQAQGVTQAGIVKETYDLNADIGYPLIVNDLLKDLDETTSIHVIDMERDDEED